MEYFIDALKQFANFSGRATRQQYWMFILIYIIISVLLSIVDGLMGSVILSGILTLVMFIPSISIAARRLHDTGRSGWWQLLVLIPLIGAIVVIVFLCQASQGENEYG